MRVAINRVRVCVAVCVVPAGALLHPVDCYISGHVGDSDNQGDSPWEMLEVTRINGAFNLNW